jgi:hypothetical protein
MLPLSCRSGTVRANFGQSETSGNQFHLPRDLFRMCPCESKHRAWTRIGKPSAQAVSRWLMGFVVDKVALEQVFSEYFGFSCQSFHRLLHTHQHPLLWAGAIGQAVDSVSSHPNKETHNMMSDCCPAGSLYEISP